MIEAKLDIQTEEKMTAVNPLSEIPEGVLNVREGCLIAFENARKAFGEQMGSDFEDIYGRLDHADFEVIKENGGHTIGTRLSDGTYLSLTVDEDTIVLSLVREGKEDVIRYEDGEISRRRMV